MWAVSSYEILYIFERYVFSFCHLVIFISPYNININGFIRFLLLPRNVFIIYQNIRSCLSIILVVHSFFKLCGYLEYSIIKLSSNKLLWRAFHVTFRHLPLRDYIIWLAGYFCLSPYSVKFGCFWILIKHFYSTL